MSISYLVLPFNAERVEHIRIWVHWLPQATEILEVAWCWFSFIFLWNLILFLLFIILFRFIFYFIYPLKGCFLMVEAICKMQPIYPEKWTYIYFSEASRYTVFRHRPRNCYVWEKSAWILSGTENASPVPCKHPHCFDRNYCINRSC